MAQDAVFEDAHLLSSLWPSPRTTENTQAARRKGAGPRQQLCRQTNAAVQKAGAERHILLGSSYRARRPSALRLWMGARSPWRRGAPRCPADRAPLGSFPQVPAAPSSRCRYAEHLRAHSGLPRSSTRRDQGERRLLGRPEGPGDTASGGSERSAARSGTKKSAFVSLQPVGLLLHKSA